jgi:hypothetical protein
MAFDVGNCFTAGGFPSNPILVRACAEQPARAKTLAIVVKPAHQEGLQQRRCQQQQKRQQHVGQHEKRRLQK